MEMEMVEMRMFSFISHTFFIFIFSLWIQRYIEWHKNVNIQRKKEKRFIYVKIACI